MSRFLQLGRINRSLQSFISDFFQWKKNNRRPPPEIIHFEFTDIAPLADAEAALYRVGISVDEAARVLDEQLANLKEMARFMAAQICASVLGEVRVLTNRRFVERLDIAHLHFDPQVIRENYLQCESSTEKYLWTLNSNVLHRLVNGQSVVVDDEQEVLEETGVC